MAQGRDKWCVAVVNIIMNIQASSNVGNSLTSLGILAS